MDRRERETCWWGIIFESVGEDYRERVSLKGGWKGGTGDTTESNAVAPSLRKVWEAWNEEQERRRKEPRIDPERLSDQFEDRLMWECSKL